MFWQAGLTVGAVILTGAVLMRWLIGGARSPIDAGVVSQGWLAELKLGKRDSPWH
jgi:hypothetical protein